MAIRAIITTKCQLNCNYCHKEGWRELIRGEVAQFDKLINNCKTLSHDYGYDLTLSGGEPLLYPSFTPLVHSLNKLGFSLTLLTNGHLLINHLNVIELFNSVHVSIPSLRSQDYFNITGHKIDSVIHGILALKRKNIQLNIKINCVIGALDYKINDILHEMVDFASSNRVTVKFIAKFNPIKFTSFPIVELKKSLQKMGYSLVHDDGRTKILCHKNQCSVELTEVSCAVAQQYQDPCKVCKMWGDIFIGVNGEIFYCPWEKEYLTMNNKSAVTLKSVPISI